MNCTLIGIQYETIPLFMLNITHFTIIGNKYINHLPTILFYLIKVNFVINKIYFYNKKK